MRFASYFRVQIHSFRILTFREHCSSLHHSKKWNCGLLEKNISWKEKLIFFSTITNPITNWHFFTRFLLFFFANEAMLLINWDAVGAIDENLINILRMIKKPPWPHISLYNGSTSLFYRANRFMREVKIVTAVLRLLWESFLTTSRNNNRDMCNSCSIIQQNLHYIYIYTYMYTFYLTLLHFYLQRDVRCFEKFTI